jgi:hypothetical protein
VAQALMLPLALLVVQGTVVEGSPRALQPPHHWQHSLPPHLNEPSIDSAQL